MTPQFRLFAFPLACALLSALAVGCAGWGASQNATAQLAVTQIVLRYIDEDQVDAQRVYQTLDRIEVRVDQVVDASIPELTRIALEEVAKQRLSLADRQLAEFIIARTAEGLLERQEAGTIPADLVVSVKAVIGWARDAAIISGARPEQGEQ